MRRRILATVCVVSMLLPSGAIAAQSPVAARSSGTETAVPAPGSDENRQWGLIVSGAGLAVGLGLGVWLKAEADDRYDAYLVTADPARAGELFDEAQRYDRASLVGWVVAQAAFVSVFYFLTREEPDRFIPAQGEPLLRVGEGGVELGWRLAP